MPELTIVGAGVVGLSSALMAQRHGWRVTLVDRDFDGDRASNGNAGGIAVSECIPLDVSGLGLRPIKWLLDPLGPLAIRGMHAPKLLPWFLALRKVGDPQNFARIARALAALNQRSLADFEAMMAQIGLASDLHKRGALTVYETEQAMRNDARDWELRRSLGVRWRQVEQPELRTLEPGLAPVFTHAVMLEDWAHVNDPKRIVDALRAKVRSLGASFVTGEAKRLEQSAPGQASVALVQGPRLSADRVLVCAGAWSAGLARSIGDTVLLESERGYNSTLPLCATRLNREVIFAERKFVATPLAVGLRIGGAAEFAGLTAPANFKRSGALLALARRYIPDLDERGATQWMGHRPTTPDSLPVIGVSPRAPNVLYAFGHGHLGLTQSATTAALVGELLDERAPSIDLEPYSIGRFGPSTMRTAGTTSALPT